LGNIQVISSYWAKEVPDIPNTLVAAVDFALQAGNRVVVMMDSNAHSSMWGDKKNDRKGRLMEDFLFSRNLALLNVGDYPTFTDTNGNSSCIDLTFVSADLLPFVNHWSIDREPSLSDHHLIHLRVEDFCPEERLVRDLRGADMGRFTSLIEDATHEWPFSPLDTEEKVELEAIAAEKIIIDSLNEVAGLHPARNSSSMDYWDSAIIQAKRKGLGKARKQSLRSGDPDKEAHYLLLRAEYKIMLFKAKKHSTRSFVSSTQDIAGMSFLAKITKQSRRHEIGLRRDPVSARIATSPDESLGLLLDHGFPDSIPVPDGELPRSHGPQPGVFDPLPVCWMNEHLCMAVFRKFKDFKAPGPDGIQPYVLKRLPLCFLKRLHKLY
jgi:hypothetical protein